MILISYTCAYSGLCFLLVCFHRSLDLLAAPPVLGVSIVASMELSPSRLCSLCSSTISLLESLVSSPLQICWESMMVVPFEEHLAPSLDSFPTPCHHLFLESVHHCFRDFCRPNFVRLLVLVLEACQFLRHGTHRAGSRFH